MFAVQVSKDRWTYGFKYHFRKGWSLKEYPWQIKKKKVCKECGTEVIIKEDALGPYETCPKCHWANPIGFFNRAAAEYYDNGWSGRYTGD